jgi:hypothetical protein
LYIGKYFYSFILNWSNLSRHRTNGRDKRALRVMAREASFLSNLQHLDLRSSIRSNFLISISFNKHFLLHSLTHSFISDTKYTLNCTFYRGNNLKADGMKEIAKTIHNLPLLHSLYLM